MKKAIVLLSGGLDSTTCLAYAKSKDYVCYALSFAYGQKNYSELNAAKKIAAHYRVKSHAIVDIELDGFTNSALIDKNIEIPDHTDDNKIPTTYVPARNTIFLSYALALAEIKEVNTIFIGVNICDYSGYPDCRPEYINAFQTMANLATKKALEGQTIVIKTPLIELKKQAIIKLGLSLGVKYEMTVTCYRATVDGLACGECDSCYYRKNGFMELGIADPTRYFNSKSV